MVAPPLGKAGLGRLQDPALADLVSAVFVSKRGKGLMGCDFVVMGVGQGVMYVHNWKLQNC